MQVKDTLPGDEVYRRWKGRQLLGRHLRRNQPCTYRNHCPQPKRLHHRHTFCWICLFTVDEQKMLGYITGTGNTGRTILDRFLANKIWGAEILNWEDLSKLQSENMCIIHFLVTFSLSQIIDGSVLLWDKIQRLREQFFTLIKELAVATSQIYLIGKNRSPDSWN